MNDSVKIATTAALAAVAAVALAGVAGLLPGTAAPPAAVGAAPDPAPDRTAEASTLQGNVSRTLRNVSWIDIAYEIHDGMTEDSVVLNFTATWGEPPRDDRTQPWMCAADAAEMEPRTQLSSRRLDCITWPGDGAFEVNARYGDHEVDRHVSAPHCRVLGCLEGGEMGTYNHGSPLLNLTSVLQGRDQRTYHILVATGAYPPAEIEVEGHVRDTEAVLRTGTGGDVFTRFREDFDSNTFVRADPPEDLYYQSPGQHVLEAPDDDRHMVFWYQPFGPDANEDARSWYERPDGTRVSDEGWAWFWDASRLDGPWTFGYSGSYGYSGDSPLLTGMHLELADAPRLDLG